MPAPSSAQPARLHATYVGVEHEGSSLLAFGLPGCSPHIDRHELAVVPGLALVLEHRPPVDGVTGLMLREDLEQELDARAPDAALLLVRIVDLGRIRHALGAPVADEVLQMTAERLRVVIERDGGSAAVARVGPDVFGIVCAASAGSTLAEIVQDVISAPFSLYGRETALETAIGWAIPSDAPAGEAFDQATMALEVADEGGSPIECYRPALRQVLLDRVELEHGLRHALRDDKLELHYQPVVDAFSRQVRSAEALARWPVDGGSIGPDRFIPVAEESGLILDLGAWALDAACAQVAAWRSDGRRELRVAVNISARQLNEPELTDQVVGSLRRHGLAGDALILEITESVLMEDAAAHLATMQALRETGVSLSIDDFGTGYSSLAYLKRFPIQVLKVDRSFISGIADDEQDAAIVDAMIALASVLGLGVVAEGVESEAQLRRLQDLGCDEVQGYLTGRPAPARQLERYL